MTMREFENKVDAFGYDAVFHRKDIWEPGAQGYRIDAVNQANDDETVDLGPWDLWEDMGEQAVDIALAHLLSGK